MRGRLRDHPSVLYSGNPVYVIVTQNNRPDNPTHPDPSRRDQSWWIGSRGEYGDHHQTIIDRANQLGITVVHMKLSNQPLLAGKSYRNFTFRLLNNFPIAQGPLLEWLGMQSPSALPKDVTVETIIPFYFDCSAYLQPQDMSPGSPRP